MGLLPLEFKECLQDSPYFRDSLHSHEKELERTSLAIKDLIKDVKTLLNHAKTLSQSQRRLSQRLVDFKFECIGNRQTDDEIVIAGSLREFGKLIAAIEDEKDRMLDRAYEQFIEPLERFRREQIGAVKERKKKFEKQTAKFCASQERYLGLSTKKQDTTLKEADATLEMEQRDFIRAGLEYVCLIQEVQERKKFEFVETLLGFMYGWLTFYHQGYEVAKDFNPHMLDLQTRIQKTRENYNASREDIQALMRRMLEVRNAKPIDPGTLNKMFTRTGYLFLMEKKALGSSWNKYYCHYQKDGRVFCMIPYNQTTPKIVSNDTPGVVYTFQALSEDDLQLWLDAMDGKEPMYEHPPRPSDANQTYLDEVGFTFVQRCFQVLECRGLEEQGLYRVVGVSSKVTKLLTMGLDRRKSEKLNLEDKMEWESKTITSAIKTFFRNLPEPIMSYRFHSQFIGAAKLDTYEERVAEVQRLVEQLPEPNKRMLELLLDHLEKVALKCNKNMMTVSNLGVCFGPTLLKAEEETVAAIMDIKFGNVMVEILIENWRQILCGEPPRPSPSRRLSYGSSPKSKSPHSPNSSGLTVLPVGSNTTSPTGNNTSSRLTTPPQRPQRPPPPYFDPPPPPGGGSAGAGAAGAAGMVGNVATLAHAVIYNNGPKQAMVTNKSPPAHSPPLPPAAMNPPSYATWERTHSGASLRGAPSTSNLVAPPMGSAPSMSQQQRGGIHSSLSNLSGTPSKQSSNAEEASPTNANPGPWYRQLPQAGLVQSSKNALLHRQLSVGQSSLSGTEDLGASQGTGPSPSQASPRPSSYPHPPPRTSRTNIPPRSSQGSSSSSIESLTSGSSKGLSSVTYPTHRGSESGASHPGQRSPLAAPRHSLTGTISAPPSGSSYSTSPSSHSPKTGQSDLPVAPPRASIGQSADGPPRNVRTLYACVAEHETELSFEPNQIIVNVRPSLEPGWLEGTLEGKFGLVPENYVEFIS
ncbi:hypothetical protein TCAL_06711 [Tigriopus californicus]|uniref:Rho GTPase-activating protein 26 n=1 Tax=Tigriopus californicus TaxID=6832 RepID=A0A553P8T6_TIGCA|nr:hypothetical protein TCAL_06711 [Tigriopus californicus]